MFYCASLAWRWGRGGKLDVVTMSHKNNVESAEAIPLLGTDGKSSISRTGYFHLDGNTAPPASAGSSSPLEETATASHDEPQASLTQVVKTETHDKTRGKKRKGKVVSLMTIDASNKKKKRFERPQKSICHLFFDALRYFAMAASAMMLTIQIVPLAFFWRDTTWLQVAVKSYLVLFCASFVVTESHIPLLKSITFHKNWITRGFVFTFIGLVGMEQDLAIKVEEIAAGKRNVLGPTYGVLFATLFMTITTWFVIGVGIVYTLLGLLCCQRWYERLENEHKEKVKEWARKQKRESSSQNQHQDKNQCENQCCDEEEGRGNWYDDLG